ncbi:hypothetical protein B0T10DRAFT_604654 [Thelonectria olida]|uniref:Uncharacterized protein n=1 Tax=Thelonectria olida TaxID=1576542 RepID=A0A9P8W915_9HYPO|nr:hypothetical protein B0T10DRAFT_604654 [Thelonectria olida]
MSNPTPDFYISRSFIHKGGWTNWNGNTNTGGKITITKSDADLLMIFIGIFFVFAEAGVWSLISFACFSGAAGPISRPWAALGQGRTDIKTPSGISSRQSCATRETTGLLDSHTSPCG